MPLPISAPYMAVLAVYALVLGAMVSIHRARTNISILHGDDVVLAEKMRRHGNFVESVPLALLLMVVAELQGLASIWLHGAGVLLLVGRFIHPFGIKYDNPNNVLRGVGSLCTTASMLICMVYLIWNWML